MKVETKLGEIKVFQICLAQRLQAKGYRAILFTLKRSNHQRKEPGLPACSKTNENTFLGTHGQHGLRGNT